MCNWAFLIFAGIFIGIAAYWVLIGYGCLWSQYIWNNVFRAETSCVPITD